MYSKVYFLQFLLACPFSWQVWYEILSWLRVPYNPLDGEPSTSTWWLSVRQHTPKPMRKGLASATLLIPWMLWKHRNDCVFDKASPSIPTLLDKDQGGGDPLGQSRRVGLRALIPQTWDVH